MPARLDWPSVIGNFLLNYGTLDYLVFVFLKDNLPPDQFKSVRKQHFKDRINRIQKHLEESKRPAEELAAFANMVERLEPIRVLRNHIAHGHMYCRFDLESKKFAVTVLKAAHVDTGFLPESKHVEFKELVNGLTTLSELVGKFQELAGFDVRGGGGE